MLETVEQIENALMDLLIQHQDQLGAFHERVDFVQEEARKMLEQKEKELDEKYADRTDTDGAQKEYLEEYKAAQATILKSVENTLKKESEVLLQSIS